MTDTSNRCLGDDDIAKLVKRARWRARGSLYDGKDTRENHRMIRSCTHHMPITPELRVTLIYTRDIGHHSSGWWKNPDYERCEHLSCSYQGPEGFTSHIHDVSALLARAFWPDHYRWAWLEPPYTDAGKQTDVWHYRLFCDPAWSAILPRGEVYSRENTPADWRSFSEVHGLSAEQIDAPFLLNAT